MKEIKFVFKHDKDFDLFKKDVIDDLTEDLQEGAKIRVIESNTNIHVYVDSMPET